MRKYYLYRFLNEKDEIIYVGKTKQDLEKRFLGHNHLPKDCYDKIVKREYATCNSECDMFIYEVYYINKYKPIYNTATKFEDDIYINLPELKWNQYEHSKKKEKTKELQQTTIKHTVIKNDDKATYIRVYKAKSSAKCPYEPYFDEDMLYVVNYNLEEFDELKRMLKLSASYQDIKPYRTKLIENGYKITCMPYRSKSKHYTEWIFDCWEKQNERLKNCSDCNKDIMLYVNKQYNKAKALKLKCA